VELTVSSASTNEYVGDLAVLVHKMCDMEQIQALVVYARMGDRVHLVARSRVPEVDVGAIARHFGGGGHPEAASASIRDRTPIEVRDELRQLLPKVIKPRVSARDICTAPVKTVSADNTLEEVRDLLNRYHINVVPVMQGEKVLGILTRIVIERATQHGLAASRAEEYMSSEFATVSPETSLDEVRELVVGGRQRFIPVMDDGKLVGALTRTDLLQALTPSSDSAIYRSPRQSQVRHAKKMLDDVLSVEVVELLKTIGEAAMEMGMRSYLVGGMVRDLVLRKQNIDIDIVVEGDGIELARRIGRRLGATVRPHKLFGTAKLIFPDGFTIDVATARTEYYHEPAALPSVEQSSLKLDLSRRDFTINALALRLEPDSFGEVIDFFGGFTDIKNRNIRILHNLSFVEDPTRILRATRFMLRFDFEFGSQTRKLLSAAVRNGFLAQARGPRLLNELKMLLTECHPVEALEALDNVGALQGFHPDIRYSGRTIQLVHSTVEVLAWFELLYLDRPVVAWKLYVMSLLSPLDGEQMREWARAFGVLEREGGEVIGALEVSRAVLEKLARLFYDYEEPPQSLVRRACEGTSTEALLFAMATTRDERKRRAISLYFTRLSSISTLVTGKDLMQMQIPPGPVYRKLLDGLLDHKLDTRIATKDEEMAWLAKERKRRGV
jgi:tRNA nucleotidyltransferase (CCA-adding enzyme)